MTDHLPTSLIELVAFVLLLGFNAWQARKTSHTQKSVSKVETQVTNGGTNLAMTVGEIKEKVGQIAEQFGDFHSRLSALERKSG